MSSTFDRKLDHLNSHATHEQNGVADEDKSVSRQIEHAKVYAGKKGWIVVDEYVYIDDGISGAEFVKRPGFLRLMNSLKPRPPFEVLLMSEESRLGREQIETAYALKQIIDAGVRVLRMAAVSTAGRSTSTAASRTTGAGSRSVRTTFTSTGRYSTASSWPRSRRPSMC